MTINRYDGITVDLDTVGVETNKTLFIEDINSVSDGYVTLDNSESMSIFESDTESILTYGLGDYSDSDFMKTCSDISRGDVVSTNFIVENLLRSNNRRNGRALNQNVSNIYLSHAIGLKSKIYPVKEFYEILSGIPLKYHSNFFDNILDKFSDMNDSDYGYDYNYLYPTYKLEYTHNYKSMNLIMNYPRFGDMGNLSYEVKFIKSSSEEIVNYVIPFDGEYYSQNVNIDYTTPYINEDGIFDVYIKMVSDSNNVKFNPERNINVISVDAQKRIKFAKYWNGQYLESDYSSSIITMQVEVNNIYSVNFLVEYTRASTGLPDTYLMENLDNSYVESNKYMINGMFPSELSRDMDTSSGMKVTAIDNDTGIHYDTITISKIFSEHYEYDNGKYGYGKTYVSSYRDVNASMIIEGYGMKSYASAKVEIIDSSGTVVNTSNTPIANNGLAIQRHSYSIPPSVIDGPYSVRITGTDFKGNITYSRKYIEVDRSKLDQPMLHYDAGTLHVYLNASSFLQIPFDIHMHDLSSNVILNTFRINYTSSMYIDLGILDVTVGYMYSDIFKNKPIYLSCTKFPMNSSIMTIPGDGPVKYILATYNDIGTFTFTNTLSRDVDITYKMRIEDNTIDKVGNFTISSNGTYDLEIDKERFIGEYGSMNVEFLYLSDNGSRVIDVMTGYFDYQDLGDKILPDAVDIAVIKSGIEIYSNSVIGYNYPVIEDGDNYYAKLINFTTKKVEKVFTQYGINKNDVIGDSLYFLEDIPMYIMEEDEFIIEMYKDNILVDTESLDGFMSGMSGIVSREYAQSFYNGDYANSSIPYSDNGLDVFRVRRSAMDDWNSSSIYFSEKKNIFSINMKLDSINGGVIATNMPTDMFQFNLGSERSIFYAITDSKIKYLANLFDSTDIFETDISLPVGEYFQLSMVCNDDGLSFYVNGDMIFSRQSDDFTEIGRSLSIGGLHLVYDRGSEQIINTFPSFSDYANSYMADMSIYSYFARSSRTNIHEVNKFLAECIDRTQPSSVLGINKLKDIKCPKNINISKDGYIGVSGMSYRAYIDGVNGVSEWSGDANSIGIIYDPNNISYGKNIDAEIILAGKQVDSPSGITLLNGGMDKISLYGSKYLEYETTDIMNSSISIVSNDLTGNLQIILGKDISVDDRLTSQGILSEKESVLEAVGYECKIITVGVGSKLPINSSGYVKRISIKDGIVYFNGIRTCDISSILISDMYAYPIVVGEFGMGILSYNISTGE